MVPLRDRRLHDGHEPRHTGDRPAVAGPSAPRILRIIARLNVGGPARHVVLVDRGLRARGYDTLLVHGSVGPGEASFEHLARGIGVVKIPELGRRISVVDDLGAFFRLLRVVFEQRPDVIHTHTAKAGAVGRVAALAFNATRRRSRRSVVVHTFHGHVLSGYFSPAMNWVVRATERALARVTDCVVTISPAQQLEIVNRFGIAPLARTAVVPLGLELDALLALAPGAADLRAALDIPPDAVVAGYVGRFVAIKNLELLLSAFADALARVPRLVLLLAGDGPARAALEAQARALGILPAVRFAGWLEDLPALYATIDIGVISSRNEGTPVAIIEAMAAGKPVVATAVGGVPDVVEHERTGLLVAPDDRQALAATLARLAADAGLRAALGRAGRAQAVRFSSVRLIDDLDRLYRQMLAAKRTASSPAS